MIPGDHIFRAEFGRSFQACLMGIHQVLSNTRNASVLILTASDYLLTSRKSLA